MRKNNGNNKKRITVFSSKRTIDELKKGEIFTAIKNGAKLKAEFLGTFSIKRNKSRRTKETNYAEFVFHGDGSKEYFETKKVEIINLTKI